jgi:hypothetical protein
MWYRQYRACTACFMSAEYATVWGYTIVLHQLADVDVEGVPEGLPVPSAPLGQAGHAYRYCDSAGVSGPPAHTVHYQEELDPR